MRLTGGNRTKEPTIDELVTRLVHYIEVRAKDVGERMERSKAFNASVKRLEQAGVASGPSNALREL